MKLNFAVGIVAALAVAVAACGDTVPDSNTITEPSVARHTEYNESNSGEYICSMTVNPSSQSVTRGYNAHFAVYRNICDRATSQFLYTDTRGTYWSTSNTSISSVGGATNSATLNVTVSTSGAGTVTITAHALCCSIDYQDVYASGTLIINAPLTASISGPGPGGTITTGTFTWTGSGTYGTTPYTYLWERRNFCESEYQGLSTSSTYTESTTYGQEPFWLRLTVTDASGATDTVYRHIGGFVECE